MVMAVVAVVVLAGFVLPRFEVFFERSTPKLPLPTRMLLGIANFFTNEWTYRRLVVVLATGGISSPYRDRGASCDTALLRIPVLGDLITTAILERFCRILCTMSMPECRSRGAPGHGRGDRQHRFRQGLFGRS